MVRTTAIVAVRLVTLAADAVVPFGPLRRALVGGPVPTRSMIRAWSSGGEVRDWRVGLLPTLQRRLER